MPGPYRAVSFLTDYGLRDEFVGVCHSVIADIAPDVRVIDITHNVAAHDVRAGSLALVRAVQYLVPGVVLAVVDPGVATARRAVAVEVGESGEAVFVGPDNGLLAPAVGMCGGARRAVEITNPAYSLPAPGPTFAGRDVFAPAAAHLAAGVDLSELGPAVEPASLLPGLIPLPEVSPDLVVAEVLWIDAFGNAQLNVGPDDVSFIDEPVTMTAGTVTRVAQRSTSYDEIPPGKVGLVTDSYGMVSIALPRESAALALSLSEGAGVRLQPAT